MIGKDFNIEKKDLILNFQKMLLCKNSQEPSKSTNYSAIFLIHYDLNCFIYEKWTMQLKLHVTAAVLWCWSMHMWVWSMSAVLSASPTCNSITRCQSNIFTISFFNELTHGSRSWPVCKPILCSHNILAGTHFTDDSQQTSSANAK